MLPIRSLAVILSVIALWLPAARAQPVDPPNIVLIMADDLGYGDVSPYGGWIETPALERLAAEGMRFTDFHASAPVCSPTRAGLMTGRYQQRAGLARVIYAAFDRNRHHGLQPQEITMAELLREAGYATGVFGKWHLGYRERYNPLHHGFDHFRGYVSGNVDYFSHVDGAGVYDWWDGTHRIVESGYVTQLITEHAVRFLEEHQDQPFLLYLPHEAPHYPFQGPDDEPFREVGRQVRETREPVQVRRAYREMVEEMDKGIGKVLATLDRLGLAEKTLVFFLSDNGALEFGSNGDLRGYKGSLWEGGHRVPAIARWPGKIEAGAVSDELTLSIDLMPTLLELANVRPPEGHQLDGVGLQHVLLEKGSLPERTLFWDYEGQAAVRLGPWKLVQEQADNEHTTLYHLGEDPGETKDLAAQEPKRVQALLTALDSWRAEVNRDATVQPSQ